MIQQRHRGGSARNVILIGIVQIVLMAACFQAGRISVLQNVRQQSLVAVAPSGSVSEGHSRSITPTNASTNLAPIAGATLPKPAMPPAAPIPFGDGELSTNVSWNFHGPCPVYLVPWGSQRPDAREPVEDGLRVHRAPLADASEFAVGYEVACEFAGDFEITLDYRDFKSIALARDWRVPRIDISGKIYPDGDSNQPMQILGIAHRREADQKLKATATQGNKGSDGKMSYLFNAVPLERDSGRLRLVRQKEWMFYQTASIGTDNWITITCRAVDLGTFKEIGLGFRSEDMEGSGEAVLLALTIRAADMMLR